MKQASIKELTSQLSPFGLQSASFHSREKRVASGIEALDKLLEGGLSEGSVSEWGMPFGQQGRELIIPWLATMTEENWALWILSRPGLSIYPPAWAARGVSLQHMRFAHSNKPVAELKQAFMEPFFKFIIIDAPMHFSPEDCAFVAKCARANGQIVILLRNWLLSSKKGNVWAKTRLNCCFDEKQQSFVIKALRGGFGHKQITLANMKEQHLH